MSYVRKTSGCWLWTASCNSGGYGQFKLGRSLVRAHRLSWFIHRGFIPEGILVLHDCPDGDNRLCVNPAHLFLGTQADNVADMQRKGRGRCGRLKGEELPSTKLTAKEVVRTRELYATGAYTQKVLAEMLGVSQVHVSRIIRGKNWVHV